MNSLSWLLYLIGDRVISSQKAGELVSKVIDPSVTLLNEYITKETRKIIESAPKTDKK